ncbi:MAG: DUF4178 domain-containing protein, partial [Elusimicrobia bacterium]|nr:DUF4178 domain-containing protein [Elusimicrobiota bacterium]
QGAYAVSFQTQAPAPAFGDLKVLATVEIKGRSYQVLEVIEAKYLAAEGELPFKPPLGESVPSADLIGENGAFGTIDYSDDPPSVFLGEYQDFDALRFTHLKAIEGWP